MLHRWKQILTNWNNCYFSENIKDEHKIDIDSLINIISHLRQNYSLDESKSSVLQAHTVNEFIIEKYPTFKFENGTTEPKVEDEFYYVASLLLFFVCVNSKDIDIKNAMCSKLCSEDQEIILKFSKSLLECSAISYRDVQAAITEACGQDIAAMEVPARSSVTETPPALRSLHSEVRRLQAALDAERFDRNYLQEELTRTNARVDKLLKEKEQHKLDIVNLKAKISLCGGENESKGSEGDDRSAKLTKQLHELEEKLVETQERLDDVVYHRDTYKAKVEELKQERDKWLCLHQEEALRAFKLSEDLETERHRSQTLEEVLSELRQHNKLNGLDSSLLECDDADPSNISLQHNASVCSEACANVVEVQLGEERAKIQVLKQQIQTLQDEMKELTNKAESEKLALESVVTEKDNSILNLKHRINEHIEEFSNMKSHYDNEITKLNNEINELGQTINANNSHSRAVIESKLQEIQTLQEDKLSILQSFDSDRTKLEKIVSDLKAEIETEKQSKSNMKDTYENHLMKLNEKVLKRNNEVVEFQNNICEKTEMIESLQLQLKKEKEASSSFIENCNSLSTENNALKNDIKQQSQNINELQKMMQVRNNTIEELNKEISHLKTALSNLNENCKDLESTKEKLLIEVKTRDDKMTEALNNIEQIKADLTKENNKLVLDLDERNEIINSLQLQLKNEIDFKVELQNELSQLQAIKKTLSEHLEKCEADLVNCKSDIENNEKTIDALDLYIKEEKKSKEQADNQIVKLNEIIVSKENEIQLLNSHIESLNKTLQEEIKMKYDVVSEMEPLHEQVKSLCNDNFQLEQEVSVKCQEILNLRNGVQELSQQIDSKDSIVRAFELKIIEECKKYDEFEKKALSELTRLSDKINETNNIADRLADLLSKDITEKETINIELNGIIENLKQELIISENEAKAVAEKLTQEANYKHILESNQQIQFAKIDNLTQQFNCTIESRNSEIKDLKSQLETLMKSLQEKSDGLNKLQEHVNNEAEANSEATYLMQNEITVLKNKIVELEKTEQKHKEEMCAKKQIIVSLKEKNKSRRSEIKNMKSEIEAITKSIKEKSDGLKVLRENVKQEEDTRGDSTYQNEITNLKKKIVEWEALVYEIAQDLKKEIDAKDLVIKALKEENEQFQYSIEEDNSNHEVVIKEKDHLIDKLEHTVKENDVKFKDLHAYTEELKKSWDDYKTNTTAVLNAKDEEIIALQNDKVILKTRHTDLLHEKDICISKLKESAIEETARYKMLHDYSENLVRSWEDYKHRNTSTLNDKDEEITEFKCNIITLEQTILELEQNNQDLNKRFLEFEESKKVLENILSEEETSKRKLEIEMKQLINEHKTILSIKEKLELQVQNLSQELSLDRHDIKVAESEKNEMLSEKIKMADNLAKSSEMVSTLLKDKEQLTKQLNAERNCKEIAEKERDNFVTVNETLKESITEGVKVKAELNQKLQVLNQQVKDLQKTLSKEKKAVDILEELKNTLNKELDQAKINDKFLKEENKNLTNEKDKLTKQLEEISTSQASLVVIKDLLNAEQATLKHSLDVQMNKINVLEKENADLKSQADKLNSNISDLQDNCKELYDKVCSKQATEDELAKQFKERVNETARLIQDNISKNVENPSEDTNIKENGLNQSENIKLNHEAKKLLDQNDKLIAVLSTEKSAFDELLTEKSNIEKNFKDLQAQFEDMKKTMTENINEITKNYNKTSEELTNREEEFKLLQTIHQGTQDTTSLISATINEGLDKLLLKFKNENFNNPVLQKLIELDYQEIKLTEKCNFVISIANALTSEIENLKNLETALKNENIVLVEMQERLKQKELEIFDLKSEVNKFRQTIHENNIELSKRAESYSASMEAKIKDIQNLQKENQALHSDLNDVKYQLEIKVHSLKEKLVDNEVVTDKLKKTYECQIENLNLMINKLSHYLKEKSAEMDSLRKEKEQLHETLEKNCKAIKLLEDEVRTEKLNVDKIITDFDAERQVLKNMVTVTEAVMEDQKISLNNVISEHIKAKETLQKQVDELTQVVKDTVKKHQYIETAFNSMLSLLRRERVEKDVVEKESEHLREFMDELICELSKERNRNLSVVSYLETQNKELVEEIEKYKNDLEILKKSNEDMKTTKDALENEVTSKTDELSKVLQETSEVKRDLKEQIKNLTETQDDINKRLLHMNEIVKEKENAELKVSNLMAKFDALKENLVSNEVRNNEDVTKLKNENQELVKTLEENKTVIVNLEQRTQHELEQNRKLREDIDDEKLTLSNKCTTLQDYQEKAEKVLEERQKDIEALQNELKTLQAKVELCEKDSIAKDGIISKMSKDKDAIISTINKELVEEKIIREKFEKELEHQKAEVHELKNNMEIRALKKENEQLIRAIGQQETFAALCHDKVAEEKIQQEQRDIHQVDNSSSDNTQSSMESLKTITDLEKIIHDKNRTITTLQQDVNYLKSLMAESETKLLDVNKELEVSKENCQQLSSQLKKIVFQKNEEIAELKKQVSKMSVTENRASQIIKVSAKYQAIILRRIAEIKSNTILKELTNFGNANCDNDLRRGLNAGTVTMEDLENFLETTDRHLKRCSEKQVALTKERDRLTEVNRINESEIINLKKFLTELSISFQTFTSVKDMYAQKLSRVISVQRTVRREILNLDSRVTDAAMCKLERGYAAVMQDLAECAMNLERWVERCLSRTVSVEKIKQAFISDSERNSLSSPSFQNTGLEIQLDELDKSFQKLLEEVARATKGDAAKDSQATTVMEVRAEYEDKLNRMKAKMKELFNEQMSVYKEKQREEIALLERELQKTRDKMEESKKEYETYIRQLTKELWKVGEKYLVKNDEAEWLRKKQKSGSLMSLQHVHSSGLIQPTEVPSRPSDASSLRSLQMSNNIFNTNKREGRQMHMSDEEGEVFDNRWLKELSTPRRELSSGQRFSELKWRNSLCPPHLKSSYPAETQFAATLNEEDLKAGAPAKPLRKEVGITAYKKPGPPTPSKQAGRLSATDSELRESLRSEPLDEALPDHSRKTSTPARIRNFLRLHKNDTNEGTPRTRRLSNIFRKNR